MKHWIFTFILCYASLLFGDLEITVSPRRAPEPTQEPANSLALSQLQCIQRQVTNRAAFIKNGTASANMKQIAPALERAFRKNKFSPAERRHFFAQMLVETAGLTSLSETANLRTDKNMENASTGSLAMVNLIRTTSMSAPPTDKKLKHNSRSVHFGDFRGRGLIQITGCDNFLSVLHYLNLQYSGSQPQWQTSWYASEEKATREKPIKHLQIGKSCSGENQKKLEEVLRIYQKNYNMDLDLYGAVSEPMRFAMVGSEFPQSPNHHRRDRSGHACKNRPSERCIDSEDFMVDATMAYWRGRCGKYITRSLNGTSSSIPECKKIELASDSPALTQVKCITRCIKGDAASSDKRLEWLRLAEQCVK